MNQNGSPIAIAAAIVAEILALWADGFDTMEIVEEIARSHCDATEAQVARLIAIDRERRREAGLHRSPPAQKPHIALEA